VIGIGALAAGIKAALTEQAFAASNRERCDDAIADFEILDLRAEFDDLAHRLVAKDVAAFHAGNDAIVNGKVRAADRAGSYFDNRVARMLNYGIWNALATPSCRAMSALSSLFF
jgi:hypothetical protein